MDWMRCLSTQIHDAPKPYVRHSCFGSVGVEIKTNNFSAASHLNYLVKYWPFSNPSAPLGPACGFNREFMSCPNVEKATCGRSDAWTCWKRRDGIPRTRRFVLASRPHAEIGGHKHVFRRPFDGPDAGCRIWKRSLVCLISALV